MVFFKLLVSQVRRSIPFVDSQHRIFWRSLALPTAQLDYNAIGQDGFGNVISMRIEEVNLRGVWVVMRSAGDFIEEPQAVVIPEEDARNELRLRAKSLDNLLLQLY